MIQVINIISPYLFEYFHLIYLTYMQSTLCEMLGWMKHKLESKFPEEISITSDMQITPPLWQKVMNMKEESKRSGLHRHQDSMVLAQRQKYRSMEQNIKPRNKSTNLWTPYLRQRRQEYTMEKRQPL